MWSLIVVYPLRIRTTKMIKHQVKQHVSKTGKKSFVELTDVVALVGNAKNAV